MKNRIIVFLGFLFISNLVSQTNVSGYILTDTNWDLSGSPYQLTGHLYKTSA